ncbi:hypothetical protein CCMSSC00406_0007686 [Pleurotus cornucopiae]|uniref:Uncharacterized protein n=1 Tax=Pleurotus cornucopiae TaxID=5321 RepID=A0ACB7J1X7_PLECO|nr:hypothetical protein CCMSSC00406_0007686 [Pleurotus cornucopiae]
MLSTLPLGLAALATLVAASPSPSTESIQHVALKRQLQPRRTPEEFESWAKLHRDMLRTKYLGTSSSQKRAEGTNLLVNQNLDSSFFGSLAIGTPPVAFNVILDTGSSDLWLADNDCITGCTDVPTLDTSSSSTFVNQSESFSIQYGSGRAQGSLGQDVVQMAGFSVPNQVFGVCDRVSANLLNSPVSGLLGLGWESIASSKAKPFWQTLVSNGAWDQPVMAFQLTRFINDTSADVLAPGGTFTMGAVNSSLYTGEIDYVNIPSGKESYWLIPVETLTVQGNTVSIPTGDSSYAAIDTGTTLVGGTSEAIANIFAQIPDSSPATGNLDGYWTYPCDTAVNVTMNFGGRTWAISPADFILQRSVDGERCVGAFFEIGTTTGTSSLSWIVGDTFLKNVYSVFRYDPPSVGFAELSAAALAQNGANGLVPAPTIGSVAATVSATGGLRSERNGSGRVAVSWWTSIVATAGLVMAW